MNASWYILFVLLALDAVVGLYTVRTRKKLLIQNMEHSEKASDALAQSFVQALRAELKTARRRDDEKRLLNQIPMPKDGNRVRCYALVLQRGADVRLLVQPAETFEEIAHVAEAVVGPGWTISASAYIDIMGAAPGIPFVPPPLTPPTPIAPEKPAEPKKTDEPPIEHFINNLEYSRDNFATSDAQRRAVDAIINQIKKHHGRSHSATN